jgi:hypothetical protein
MNAASCRGFLLSHAALRQLNHAPTKKLFFTPRRFTRRISCLLVFVASSALQGIKRGAPSKTKAIAKHGGWPMDHTAAN